MLLLVVIAGLQSCEKDDIEPGTIATEDSIYFFINGLMEYWYLWNDSLPEVEYLSYDDPQALIDDLKIDMDKWSFVDKTVTVSSRFKEGEEYGFGFYLGWDNLLNLRVLFAYENTSAFDAGIRRGCIIKKIDGVDVKKIESFDYFFSETPGSKSFEFVDNSGTTHTKTLSKETYFMNAVLYSNTYNVSNKTVGYIVLQSFLGYAKDEIQEAFSFFSATGIDELVVDLRYNGGGYINLAEGLAERICPSSAIGKINYTMQHNKERRREYDTIVYFKEHEQNQDLERVFFLTNEYSASASELVINGLEPHMDVEIVGDITYGKPVAMYGFEFQDWTIYPVTAKSINANGYGEYFDGLAPDNYVSDQSQYDWGDENEPLLSSVFNYISTGSFGQTASQLKSASSVNVIQGGQLGRNLLLY